MNSSTSSKQMSHLRMSVVMLRPRLSCARCERSDLWTREEDGRESSSVAQRRGLVGMASWGWVIRPRARSFTSAPD